MSQPKGDAAICTGLGSGQLYLRDERGERSWWSIELCTQKDVRWYLMELTGTERLPNVVH